MGLFTSDKKNSLTLRVPGMHCENCERRVTLILTELPGVASVKASSRTGTVKVELDKASPADETVIREKLDAGGYPAAG